MTAEDWVALAFGAYWVLLAVLLVLWRREERAKVRADRERARAFMREHYPHVLLDDDDQA